MSLFDAHFTYLPEYSHSMYKKYGPAEVLYALRKQMHEQYQSTEQEPDFSSIKI